LFPLFIIKRG